MDKIIVVEAQKCMSCHSCELACAIAHSQTKQLEKAIYEQNRPYSNMILQQVEETTLPIHCRHCEDAPCVTVCPSGAIERPAPDSPVILDQSKCIGCHACILVCPFGVIKRGPDGKSLIKCDLCYERLKEGQEPACAEACITGCIKFQSIEEITTKKRRESYERFKVALQKGERITQQ
ncbi:MAG: 4Fe-4S dicluster domain-containing protein [Spirochaetota bacterium]